MKEPIISIEKGYNLTSPTKELAEGCLDPIDVENEEDDLFDS